MEEQQSNKNATEAYVSNRAYVAGCCQAFAVTLTSNKGDHCVYLQRLKMQEAQSQLSSLQQAYTHEKTENAQLKAKIKDGNAAWTC